MTALNQNGYITRGGSAPLDAWRKTDMTPVALLCAGPLAFSCPEIDDALDTHRLLRFTWKDPSRTDPDYKAIAFEDERGNRIGGARPRMWRTAGGSTPETLWLLLAGQSTLGLRTEDYFQCVEMWLTRHFFLFRVFSKDGQEVLPRADQIAFPMPQDLPTQYTLPIVLRRGQAGHLSHHEGLRLWETAQNGWPLLADRLGLPAHPPALALGRSSLL